MMRDVILHFHEQFLFQPKVINQTALKKKKRFLVLGMGGSHLAADIAQAYDLSLPLFVHSDYGLPAFSNSEWKDSLIIASSYSGNTEEVIDGVHQALKKKYSVAILTIGGALLAMAKRHHLPYVQMPDTGIQPRSALGFNMMGLFALMRHGRGLKEGRALASHLHPERLMTSGATLARKLVDRVPVIYASAANRAIAYNWKIKLNETGKIPAFYNVFPEVNHNEMTGFDVQPSSRHLSKEFIFLFLTDEADHPKTEKRMAVMKRLYEKRGLATLEVALVRKTRLDRIFSSLILADWAAIALADAYGLESEQVPMVEEFKKLIR